VALNTTASTLPSRWGAPSVRTGDAAAELCVEARKPTITIATTDEY
jgi:hypothetical protein